MDKSLWRLEEQFCSMIQFAPTSMIVTNNQGLIIQSNLAFKSLLGYTDEEIKNLSLSELTHPDDRTESVNIYQEMLADQRPNFS